MSAARWLLGLLDSVVSKPFMPNSGAGCTSQFAAFFRASAGGSFPHRLYFQQASPADPVQVEAKPSRASGRLDRGEDGASFGPRWGLVGFTHPQILRKNHIFEEDSWS